MQDWLLLTYKLPRHPTAKRVSVWRKLKRLGALMLYDAVWVLPATPETTEHLQWIAAEITELGGDYTLWEARVVLEEQNKMLREKFNSQVEQPYRHIAKELKKTKCDLTALARQYQQIKAQDYFHCELGKQILKTLEMRKTKR